MQSLSPRVINLSTGKEARKGDLILFEPVNHPLAKFYEVVDIDYETYDIWVERALDKPRKLSKKDMEKFQLLWVNKARKKLTQFGNLIEVE